MNNHKEDIEKFDLVEYIDAGLISVNGHPKVVKISKFGIWDGEKVELNDKEKTTVRNTKWLKIIDKNFNWRCYFNPNNINCLTIENAESKKQYHIAIPPGKNRIDLISFKDYSYFELSSFKGYNLDFEGIVIISSSIKRLAFYKGMLLTEINY